MGAQNTIRLLKLSVAMSFLLALVNHVLPPKAFAATQLLFDYSAGFTRRGLIGEGLDFLLGPKVSIQEIFAVVAGLTVLGAAAFTVFLLRNMPRQISALLVVILALNSFAFASFVGNTGYLDTVLMVLAVLALSSDAGTGVGLGLRLGLVAIGVLVHENMLPYFSVLIGFDLWLARGGGRLALPIALSPILAGLAVLGALVMLGRFSPEQAALFAQNLQAKAGFWLDPHATSVAGRTISQNFALMADLRATRKYWGWVFFDGLPLAAMSLWLIWLARRLLQTTAGLVTRLLPVAAILAPLSLNIIAFDVVRFGVASVLVGFIALAVIIRSDPKAAARLEATLSWPHFLFVLIVNVNIFSTQINIASGHTGQFPWVLLSQMKWFSP